MFIFIQLYTKKNFMHTKASTVEIKIEQIVRSDDSNFLF